MQLPANPVKSYVLLVLLCSVLYGAGLTTLPATDRDEARFAQATRQMFESRDFVRIRFQDQPRHKKPIGIYWLQAAAVAATDMIGTNQIWPYRIPSLLGATLAALLTAALGKMLFDAHTARLAGLLLGSSLLLTVEAHLAKTDAMLLAAIVVAQGSLGHLYVQAQRGQGAGIGTALAFWIAQGVGILLKGPIAPLVSLLTIGALWAADRKAGWLKGLRCSWGIPLACLMACPWFIAVGLATHGAFFGDALRNDLLPKLVSGHESHGFPPGYYALLMPITFWPASLFAGFALHQAWKHRALAGERFCLAWIVPAWLLFELIPSKLPHYILPVYPALALLSARWVLAGSSDALPVWGSWLARVTLFAWSCIGIAMAIGIVALPWVLEGRLAPVTLWPALAALFAALAPVWSMTRGRTRAAAAMAVLGAVLVFAPLLQTVLPSLDALWLSRSVARAVEAYAPPGERSQKLVVSCGYQEPSLVFLLGTETKFIPPDLAARYLSEHPETLALTANKTDAEFRRQLAELDHEARKLATIRGINYSKGRWDTLTLYAPQSALAR